MSFTNLSRRDAVTRMEAAQARMEQLGAKHRLARSEQSEFDELSDEFRDLEAHVKRIDGAARITEGLRTGRMKLEGPDSGIAAVVDGQAGGPAANGERDRAMRTLDSHVSTGALAARSAEAVEALMTTGTGPAQSWTQRWAAAAGSTEYMRAFAKLVGNPVQGHLTWTPAEAEAYRRVAEIQTEQRAMGIGTDGAGGYMVPLTLDPAVQITGGGSTNPLRQISRVVQTVSDTWQGVTSAGVTAEWTAEAAEVADASPTLAGPSIPVHKGDAFVPFSFEVQGDALGFMEELGKLLADGAEQLTATAYTLGTGSGQPKGVITAVAAASPSVVVAPATAETLAADDVFAVQSALPPRFQPNASWTANLGIANLLRQMETTNGALKFPELAANPPALLGKPFYENSNMVAKLDPNATDTGRVLLYGDFAQGFVIADRIGSTIELVPHLFGSNRRPTGQRGALLWFRTGSDVVAANAFRLLAIPTSA